MEPFRHHVYACDQKKPEGAPSCPGRGSAAVIEALRREITAQGRSRAFVNGALATAGALKDLSSRLIELHGQHEHQTLLDPATHLDVVDAVGALESLAAPVGTAFEAMRAAADELKRAERAVLDREARQDLVAFQLAELDRAQLRADHADEDVELAETRQVLASAERVERLCEESYASLYESDAAVLSQLGSVWRRVGELAALDRAFQPYLESREAIKSQLEDLAAFLRRYAGSIEASPDRLQELGVEIGRFGQRDAASNGLEVTVAQLETDGAGHQSFLPQLSGDPSREQREQSLEMLGIARIAAEGGFAAD